MLTWGFFDYVSSVATILDKHCQALPPPMTLAIAGEINKLFISNSSGSPHLGLSLLQLLPSLGSQLVVPLSSPFHIGILFAWTLSVSYPYDSPQVSQCLFWVSLSGIDRSHAHATAKMRILHLQSSLTTTSGLSLHLSGSPDQPLFAYILFHTLPSGSESWDCNNLCVIFAPA